MQVYRFIFLARSWAHDKLVLVSHLAKLGRKAHLEDTPLAFLIYPEGTVISNDTRPISKKYADKLGIVRELFLSACVEVCLSQNAYSPTCDTRCFHVRRAYIIRFAHWLLVYQT